MTNSENPPLPDPPARATPEVVDWHAGTASSGARSPSPASGMPSAPVPRAVTPPPGPGRETSRWSLQRVALVAAAVVGLASVGAVAGAVAQENESTPTQQSPVGSGSDVDGGAEGDPMVPPGVEGGEGRPGPGHGPGGRRGPGQLPGQDQLPGQGSVDQAPSQEPTDTI